MLGQCGEYVFQLCGVVMPVNDKNKSRSVEYYNHGSAIAQLTYCNLNTIFGIEGKVTDDNYAVNNWTHVCFFSKCFYNTKRTKSVGQLLYIFILYSF